MQPQTLASEVSSLFSLPDLMVRVSALMDSPTATTRELVAAIELDAGLAATVLRLANSALYGHGRVESLAHAVAIIGHKALRDLVLAVSAVRAFRDIPTEFVDMDTFWENSITCAVLAQQIGRHARLAESEALFLAGLLHGVGRLVFYARRPKEYREVLQRARGGEESLVAAERQVFGFCHAELGAALLEQWGLPMKLRVAVAHQFKPDTAVAHQKEVAAVHLAADMAAHLAPCIKRHQAPEAYVPGPVAAAAMETLGLKREDLAPINLEAMAASLEVIEIISPGASTIF